MKTSESYGGIDRFRLIATLLIVGIHTYPLSSINEELDFLVIHVFARIAVPFFLMLSGYFLLPQYLSKEKGKPRLIFFRLRPCEKWTQAYYLVRLLFPWLHSPAKLTL